MFEQICIHIKESSNNGVIIPTISIFPARKNGKSDLFRIWNPQFFQFAGYTSEGKDSWIGDKANIGLTNVSLRCLVQLMEILIWSKHSFAKNWDGKEEAKEVVLIFCRWFSPDQTDSQNCSIFPRTSRWESRSRTRPSQPLPTSASNGTGSPRCPACCWKWAAFSFQLARFRVGTQPRRLPPAIS